MDEQSIHQAQPEPRADSSDSKRASGLGVWFFYAVGILLLYVLSMGPAVHLAAKTRISFGTISTVYYPILRICEASRPAGRSLNWYLDKVGKVQIFFTPDHRIWWETVGISVPLSGKPSP
jgi:hypothetical protein